MAKLITNSTPKADGFRMPGEFEEQKQIFMIWPERTDNWRAGAKPAQKTFANVAAAISEFEPVTMCVSAAQYEHAKTMLPAGVRIIEMSSNDAWCRDMGPSFLINDKGETRACDWTFNAWGGLVDGLYFPWDKDDQIASKICELEQIDSYRTGDFVLEGGSFHVDGEGTLITTEMCLLSKGRNPHPLSYPRELSYAPHQCSNNCHHNKIRSLLPVVCRYTSLLRYQKCDVWSS